MKLLLVCTNRDIRDTVFFALESRYNIEITNTEKAEQAIDELRKKGAAFDVVLASHGDTGPELLRFQSSESSTKTHWIYWTDRPQKGTKNTHFIDQKKLIEDLTAKLAEIFKDKLTGLEQKKEEFTRIRAPLLVAVTPLSSDVFISLSKQKFLKIFQQGDEFDNQDLERYHVKKKIDYFHLRNKDCLDFIVKLKNAILSLIEPVPAPEPPPEPKAETTIKPSTPKPEKPKPNPIDRKKTLAAELEKNPAAAAEILGEVSRNLGFTPEVRELAKASMGNAVAAFKKNPTLSSFLSKIGKDKDKYIASHSALVSQLACMLASQMDWKSDTTFEKLSLAALLHDVTIKNNALAEIQTLAELKKRESEFTADEISTFKNHPIHSAEIIRSFSEIPRDVDLIVTEHHERPDGSGFPRALAQARISPLSSVFIVAHDLTNYLLNLKTNTPLTNEILKAFFEENKELYELGNFKKILKMVPKLNL